MYACMGVRGQHWVSSVALHLSFCIRATQDLELTDSARLVGPQVLRILLSLPYRCYDYKRAPPCLAYVGAEDWPQALMLDQQTLH